MTVVRISCIAAALALAGCAAHSPMIVQNTTDVHPKTTNKYAAHTDKVLFLRAPMPANVKVEQIGLIEAGKVWYGGAEDILKQMADKARTMGADAVVEVNTWHQPSGFSWAAPHGRGMAVKVVGDRSELKKLGGEWY